jgi:outer membrane receptor protein involved in Fe transport
MLPGSLLAQSAATPKDKPLTDEDIFVLSPFEVTGDSTVGYTATSSTTGTRVASSIKELPFTVNVVTNEFMTDFAAFNLQEQMAYIPGFGMKEGQGNYTMRGFQGSGMLRNGFYRGGMIDSVTLDRVEVIKGPAAAIYGRTAPGGMINNITKRPKERWEASLSQTFGGYGLSRSEGSVTGPLIKNKLSFRLDSAYYDTDSVIADAGILQRVYSGSLTYKFSKTSSLWLEVEKVYRKDRVGEFHNVWYSTDGTNNTISRIADELRTFNNQVPGAYTTREVLTTTMMFEHKLTPTLSLRIGGYIFGRSLEVFQILSSDIYNSTTKTIGGREPMLRTLPERSDAIQADLLKTFDAGNTHHKVLLTFDHFWDKNGNDRQVQLPTNLLTNPAYNIQVLDVVNPNYFVDQSLTDYTRETRNRGTIVKINGAFLSDRVSAFDGKLIALLGGRYDVLTNRFYQVGANNILTTDSRGTNKKATYQSGVNYTPIKPVTFFLNMASSFTNQVVGNLPELPDKTVVPPETGRSKEIGVKTTFMEGKVGAEIAFYDIYRENVFRTNPAVPIINGDFGGKDHSRGMEIATDFRLTKALRLFATYSRIKSDQLYIPNDPGLVGFPQTNVPSSNWGGGGRYDFKEGTLKGAYVNFGMYHNSEQLFDTGGGIRRNTPMKAFTSCDFGVGYKLKQGEHFEHVIALNLKNAFDEEYYTGLKKTANGRQFLARYSISFK